MQRARMRLMAAVMLAGWVLPLGLPLLCRAEVRDADVGCEQPMPAAHGEAFAAASTTLPCANAALCGVPTTAVPATAGVTVAATPFEHPATFRIAALHSGAPRAPLPPPPQA